MSVCRVSRVSSVDIGSKQVTCQREGCIQGEGDLPHLLSRDLFHSLFSLCLEIKDSAWLSLSSKGFRNSASISLEDQVSPLSLPYVPALLGRGAHDGSRGRLSTLRFRLLLSRFDRRNKKDRSFLGRGGAPSTCGVGG